jgi:hypothetical protein
LRESGGETEREKFFKNLVSYVKILDGSEWKFTVTIPSTPEEIGLVGDRVISKLIKLPWVRDGNRSQVYQLFYN